MNTQVKDDYCDNLKPFGRSCVSIHHQAMFTMFQEEFSSLENSLRFFRFFSTYAVRTK
jgi:hypothetical protein